MCRLGLESSQFLTSITAVVSGAAYIAGTSLGLCTRFMTMTILRHNYDQSETWFSRALIHSPQLTGILLYLVPTSIKTQKGATMSWLNLPL